MGGLAGIIHYEGAPPLRDEGRMLSTGVAHRGPDDKGWFAEGPVVLAHRRFATVRSQVPEPHEGERYVVMTDGRPHDHGAERVRELWDAEGAEALQQLMGEFALAIWDRRDRVLWLARDPCGTRPLYWSASGRRFAFASEPGPLLGLSWVSRELATDHLAEYLSFRYVHAPRTLLRDVQAVPPGHVLRVDATGQRLERWWRPTWAAPGASVPSSEQVALEVDQTLRRNVERRIAGPAEVALLLSGGLDSSAILWHARDMGKDVTAFTVSLADDRRDESAFAARVAKEFDTDHHLVRLSSQDLVDAIGAASLAMGQPLGSAAAALQLHAFEAIRPSFRIALSGDGGDEVLAGRGMERIAARLRRNQTFGRVTGPTRHAWRRVARRAGLRDLAASYSNFGRDRKIGGSQVFRAHERVAVLRDPGMVRPGVRRIVLEPLYQEIDTDPLNSILHIWQRGWLPEDTLARSDRMATHRGVDIRFPLLDMSMLRVTAALPGRAKVRARGVGFVTKAPLRDAMASRLPASLLNRPKRAMSNPLDRWLREGGASFLREHLEALCADESGLFLPSRVRLLSAEHLEGKADHGLQLWTLALFQAWKQASGL